MHRVYVSIGSNIEPAQHVRLAVAALQGRYGELIISSVYESESVGFAGENFLNLVVGFDTAQSVDEVNKSLHHIEDEQGRDRSGPRFSSRRVDLDLLLYDDLCMNAGKLVLPREEITENAFVLWPLAEIAPEVMHPLLHKSMSVLWNEFDKQKQQLWVIDFQF